MKRIEIYELPRDINGTGYVAEVEGDPSTRGFGLSATDALARLNEQLAPPPFTRREEEPVTPPPPHPETQAREIMASDTGFRGAVREMMWGK